MIKRSFAAISVILVTGCSQQTVSPHNNQASRLLFQNNGLNKLQLSVSRDAQLCNAENDQLNCPISFYIDGFKSGEFNPNNTAIYYLSNNKYTLSVKNCENDCKIDKVEFCVTDDLKNYQLTLSIDENNRPFIRTENGEKSINCPVAPPIKNNAEYLTETIDLNTDTLFTFDGSTLNDLLPEGKQSIQQLKEKIENNQLQIQEIILTGHTDRLGQADYNQRLGYQRAQTVYTHLQNLKLPVENMSYKSAGEDQPVTNGCFDVKDRLALHACLQPDRRVTVEIKGVRKAGL